MNVFVNHKRTACVFVLHTNLFEGCKNPTITAMFVIDALTTSHQMQECSPDCDRKFEQEVQSLTFFFYRDDNTKTIHCGQS